MNYQRANELLTGRCKERRKLENNTYLERRTCAAPGETCETCDSIAVRLHATDILTFFPDGRTVYDTGGWRTPTTKDRMNQYGPERLWQAKGKWYVGAFDASKRTVYADGMTVYADGRIDGAAEENGKADRRTLRQAKAYVKAFVQAVADGKVPAPSNGDCWYCLMREEKSGRPLGECTRDADHIKSHIEEQYFVPSLLWRAGELFGVSIAAKEWLAACWGTLQGATAEQVEKVRTASFYKGIAFRQWESALYRYIKRQLGFAA